MPSKSALCTAISASEASRRDRDPASTVDGDGTSFGAGGNGGGGGVDCAVGAAAGAAAVGRAAGAGSAELDNVVSGVSILALLYRGGTTKDGVGDGATPEWFCA